MRFNKAYNYALKRGVSYQDHRDVVHDAFVGASDKYDEERGLSFERFFWMKLRYAILDYFIGKTEVYEHNDNIQSAKWDEQVFINFISFITKLSTLSLEDAAIIRLRDFYGFTWPELAEIGRTYIFNVRTRYKFAAANL